MEVLTAATGPLVVPILVVTEVAYFLGSRLGAAAEVRFLGSVTAGELIVVHVHASDWLRIAELVWTYRDLPLGTVDASLVATAERLDIKQVVTLDRRDFATVRPRHVPALDLVP